MLPHFKPVLAMTILSGVALGGETGFPMDCIHAVATVFFLWFAAELMLEKLDSIKVKYGLVE